MWKLGARKADYAEGESLYLCCYLTCQAPNQATAIAFYNYTTEYLKHDLNNPIQSPLWEISPDDDTLTFGTIQRHGQRIELRLQFYEMGYGIYALVKYLEENAFTDIKYSFFQDREWT
jgi:hypothetical protein